MKSELYHETEEEKKGEKSTEARSSVFSETNVCISEEQASDARQFWQANRAGIAFA